MFAGAARRTLAGTPLEKESVVQGKILQDQEKHNERKISVAGKYIK
jgi:hypothetical protein